MKTSPVCTPYPYEHIQCLEDQITELSGHINAATYRLLVLIHEYDDYQGWEGPGMKSCAHWLNWKCGISLGAAREKVRVAHAIADLPLISSAFRLGQISYSKVRAITRVADANNEEYLLMIARHGTASHVERLVRQYRRVERIEMLEQETELRRHRKLEWYVDDDGCWVFKGRFTAEQGAIISEAIKRASESIWEEQKSAQEDMPFDQEPIDEVSANWADALERVAEGFLGKAPGVVTGGDRCLITVHTRMDTLHEEGTGVKSDLESGACITAEATRRLACDCSMVEITQDHDGTMLSVGRKTRTIPPAIRRALTVRDGGCCFPGCTQRHHVDAHHIKHWADGGETKLENLVLLCRFHHSLVHEGGFGLQALANNQFEFSRPNSQVIEPAPKTRSRGNVFALTRENQKLGLEITHETAIPDWHGETMDDDLAIMGLLQCREDWFDNFGMRSD